MSMPIRLRFASIVGTILLALGTLRAQTVHIKTVADLQNMQNNLSGNYVLDGPIDATSTSMANSGLGFIPIGNAAAPFTGTFDGQGYAINGLTINNSLNELGLFGEVGSSSTIQNVQLLHIGITTTGSGEVGSLVGRLNGQIINCSATGTITSSNSQDVGGLVGFSYGGQITASSASVTVTSTTPGGYLGGLAGKSISILGSISVITQALITTSQAVGDINGSSSGSVRAAIGGLVGFNFGQITLSSAEGSITGSGNSYVGGLIGENNQQECPNSCNENFASVLQSFAVGSVTTGGNGAAGGLVGLNLGQLIQTFAIGAVVDATSGGDEGGLVGDNEGGTVTQSYAWGKVSGQSAFAIGGLIGQNNYNNQSPIISYSYSSGAVQDPYSTRIGGLVGNSTTLTTVTDAYWDIDTSFQPTSAVGSGLSSARLLSGILPTGFDPKVWIDNPGAKPTLINNAAPNFVWLVNQDSTVDKLTTSGVLIGSTGNVNANSSRGGIAIDSSGNAWSVTIASNSIISTENNLSNPSVHSGGGLNAPSAIAVDGIGTIWIANLGGETVSAFLNSGSPKSGIVGYSATASRAAAAVMGMPSSVAIDSSGGVWVTNMTGNSVTHIFGAAKPVGLPLSYEVANGTPGIAP